MKAKKWNYLKRDYEDFEIPSRSVSLIYCLSMDDVIQCAECGKRMFFGDGYTSRVIHTKSGMGYCVCSECYLKECEEERMYEA